MREGLESRRSLGTIPFGRPARSSLNHETQTALQAAADLARLPALAKPGRLSAGVRRLRQVLKTLLRPWLAVQTRYNQLLLDVIVELNAQVRALAARVQEGYDGAANRELGPEGKIARSGLWFNPAVAVRIEEDGPVVASVSERILESIFVHTRLPRPPARILDLGCAESLNAVEMASLGFQVLGVDLRPLPVRQPALLMVRADFCRLPVADEAFDAVVSLSTLEHVGLDWYGPAAAGCTDRHVVAEIRRVLRPGGRLILTIPFGQAAVTQVQRTYDREMLDGLLGSFRPVELLFGIREGDAWSVTGDGERAAKARSVERVNAVALVVVEKP
jgi:SAM-dependent methyltransferase